MSVLEASQSETQVKRPLAGYPRSYWGDMFLKYHFDEKEHARKGKETEKLIEEVRRELVKSADHPMEQLNLIDEIQRLCVEYHFEDEIKEALERLYTTYHSYDGDDDLHSVTLRFRLLRQADYNISTECFNKLKDEKGNLKECLAADVRGMLSLYDASQLRTRGEDILDKAIAFTTAHLNNFLETGSVSNNALAAQVSHALKQQMRKNIPRLEAKHYMMYVYPNMASHNQSLLKLAKLDFNLLQSMHRRELSDLSRYWKDLEVAEKSSFARDRLVECFFLSVGIYPEPENCLARSILTKSVCMVSLIDDIYDSFGLIDELEIFAEAIERWDINCINKLPKYTQPCYKALLDFFIEIENEMEKQGRTYRVPYGIEKMKYLSRSYMKEAEWFSQKYFPPMAEYRELSLKTSSYPTLITMAFVGMGDVVTKEIFDWILTNPKSVEASATICRFTDDTVDHKFEKATGRNAFSGIECYIKQYGASEEEAYKVFWEVLVNAWMDLNEECLKKTMPKPILRVVLNFARFIEVFYSVEDSYAFNGQPAIDAITSLLVDQVPEN